MREKPSISRIARRRRRRLAERLFEDESLRDGLTDEEARRIMDWGLQQAKKAVSSTLHLDEEEARLELEITSERLRNTIRRVNRLMSKFGADEIGEAPEITRMLREIKQDKYLVDKAAHSNQIDESVEGTAELDRDQAFNQLMDLIIRDNL